MEKVLVLTPYFLSLVISLGVLVYSWQHRSVRGASAYCWYVAGQSVWILGFILELLTAGLFGKVFWDKVQWIGGVSMLIAMPLFTIQYTEYQIRRPRLFWGMLALIPVIFTLLVVSDTWHHLLYPNPQLVLNKGYWVLIYDFTWVVYAFAIYSYLITGWCLYLLFTNFRNPNRIYRWQVWTIAIGVFIPIIGTVFTILGFEFTPHRDITPLTSAIGNLVIAWGLFYFRTFEVTPVARDHIFEAMIDPVVILDNHNNIIDINRSMLDLLGMEAEQTVGYSAKHIFDEFPLPIKMYSQVKYARAESSFQVQGKTVYYEMTVWPLFNNKREMVGRIYISHDITALKELEGELRELNHDLEKRVDARTRELAEAYDTTLEGWAKALELRDKETEGHSRRVMEITLKIAQAMEIPGEALVHIRRGAFLHDIGKMAIPDEILQKNGPLTDEERLVVQNHPQIAYKLLESVPFLEKAIEIPYAHHEKWDGSGYPRGLKGRAIPLAARIFAVADVWDALRSDRPYSKQWPEKEAIDYLVEQAGKQFDPRVVNVFLKLVEEGKI